MVQKLIYELVPVRDRKHSTFRPLNNRHAKSVDPKHIHVCDRMNEENASVKFVVVCEPWLARHGNCSY